MTPELRLLASCAIVKKLLRSAVIFLYRPHRHAYQAKLNTRADKVMRIKLPMVAVWNGPALIRITLMRIQCGRMQRALLRIIMRIVGLVWTGLNLAIVTSYLCLWFVHLIYSEASGQS